VAFIAVCGLGELAGEQKSPIGASGRIFNTAQKLVTACAATIVLHLFTTTPWNPSSLLAWAGMLASGAVMVLVNSLLVAGVISLQNRIAFFPQWFSGVERASGPEIMMIGLGLLSALVVAPYPWSLILLALPGIGIYVAFSRLTRMQEDQKDLADSNARLASDLRAYSERLKETNIELEAVGLVNIELRKTLDRREILPMIVDQICHQLQAGSGLIVVKDPETGEMVYEAARGKWIRSQGQRTPEGAGIDAKICQSGQTYVHSDVRQDVSFSRLAWMDGDYAAAGVPLVAQNEVIGVLWAGRESGFDARELRLMVMIADICANALQRITLFNQVQQNAAEMAIFNQEIVAAYDTILEGWSKALEARDEETQGHSERVCELSQRLGRAMGMEPEALMNLYRGALLHDIGKMRVPDRVLNKTGPLSEEEWVMMRRHPQDAYDLLAPIPFLKPALAIPYCHHEKWDGSGYPRGLKGDRIPLAARIFSVVDVWDALNHDRPYRSAWTPEKALDYIRRQSGEQFDPQVVELFLMILEEGMPEPENLALPRAK
jgi:HD-GYP domain-containing protein (c-di-GMP phosphodiesterase class II)